MNIQDLPVEILSEVFSYLIGDNVQNLLLVNKRFSGVINNNREYIINKYYQLNKFQTFEFIYGSLYNNPFYSKLFEPSHQRDIYFTSGEVGKYMEFEVSKIKINDNYYPIGPFIVKDIYISSHNTIELLNIKGRFERPWGYLIPQVHGDYNFSTIKFSMNRLIELYPNQAEKSGEQLRQFLLGIMDQTDFLRSITPLAIEAERIYLKLNYKIQEVSLKLVKHHEGNNHFYYVLDYESVDEIKIKLLLTFMDISENITKTNIIEIINDNTMYYNPVLNPYEPTKLIVYERNYIYNYSPAGLIQYEPDDKCQLTLISSDKLIMERLRNGILLPEKFRLEEYAIYTDRSYLSYRVFGRKQLLETIRGQFDYFGNIIVYQKDYGGKDCQQNISNNGYGSYQDKIQKTGGRIFPGVDLTPDLEQHQVTFYFKIKPPNTYEEIFKINYYIGNKFEYDLKVSYDTGNIKYLDGALDKGFFFINRIESADLVNNLRNIGIYPS